MSCTLVCHSKFSQFVETDVVHVDIAPHWLVNKGHVTSEAVFTNGNPEVHTPLVCQRGHVLFHTLATPRYFSSSLVAIGWRNLSGHTGSHGGLHHLASSFWVHAAVAALLFSSFPQTF